MKAFAKESDDFLKDRLTFPRGSGSCGHALLQDVAQLRRMFNDETQQTKRGRDVAVLAHILVFPRGAEPLHDNKPGLIIRKSPGGGGKIVESTIETYLAVELKVLEVRLRRQHVEMVRPALNGAPHVDDVFHVAGIDGGQRRAHGQHLTPRRVGTLSVYVLKVLPTVKNVRLEIFERNYAVQEHQHSPRSRNNEIDLKTALWKCSTDVELKYQCI